MEDALKRILSVDGKTKTTGLSLESIVSALLAESDLQVTEKEVKKHITMVIKERDGYIMKSSKKEKGTGRVLYKLRPVKGTIPSRKRQKPETDADDTMFIGKAGEMAVISELLYQGFTANTMIVDQGIDIVASRDNKFYYIQVKTTYLDENGKCSISIPRSSFERVESLYNVSYVIVVRTGIGEHQFLVLTQSAIGHWIDDKYIEKTDANVNIKIVYDDIDKQPYLYNDRYKVKVSSYLNNFRLA